MIGAAAAPHDIYVNFPDVVKKISEAAHSQERAIIIAGLALIVRTIRGDQ